MTPAADNDNVPPGSMEGLRKRYARFLAEAEAANDDFDRGLALAAAEMTASTAMQVWGEKL